MKKNQFKGKYKMYDKTQETTQNTASPKDQSNRKSTKNRFVGKYQAYNEDTGKTSAAGSKQSGNPISEYAKQFQKQQNEAAKRLIENPRMSKVVFS